MIFSQTFGNNIGQVINVIKMSFKQFLINYRSVSTIIHSHLSWDVVEAVKVELGSFQMTNGGTINHLFPLLPNLLSM